MNPLDLEPLSIRVWAPVAGVFGGLLPEVNTHGAAARKPMCIPWEIYLQKFLSNSKISAHHNISVFTFGIRVIT